MLREKVLALANRFVQFPAMGVDISDRSMKCLQLDARRNGIIQYAKEMELPEGLIVEGAIKKEEELISAIHAWRAREGNMIRASFVVASLPEEKSFLRVLQLPKIKREEVKQAIQWEIEGNIPLAPEELYYDYEIVEPVQDHVDHFDVVIVAFPKTIVDAYVRVWEGVGWKPIVLELESQAIVRSAVQAVPETSATIVVDLGRTRTSIIVFSGGAIIFTKTIPIGGQLFEQHIAKEFQVSAAEASVLKRDVGFHKRMYDGKMMVALAPALSVLADELKHTVSYYQDHASHTHGAEEAVSNVVLTGGDANLLGLDTYLASALHIPVFRANPFWSLTKRWPNPIPSVPKNQALAFTTAIGLALREMHL